MKNMKSDKRMQAGVEPAPHRLTSTLVSVPRPVAPVCVVCLLLAAWPRICLGQFQIPKRGLPRVKIGQVDVIFMPNGSFVASRDAVYFMDGGLGFAGRDYKRWGDQIRGVLPPDGFHPPGPDGDGMALTFSGTLRDADREAVFRFQEEVSVQANSLRFDYTVKPIESIPLARLGVTFHFPIRRWSGKRLEFLPGSRDMAFQPQLVERKPDGFAGGALARCLVAGRDTPYEVAISLDRPRRWTLLDDRAWELNTYRALFTCPVAKRVLDEAGAQFSYELSFGAVVPHDSPSTEGDPNPQTQKEGTSALAVLPDDTTTQGDWQGRYGTYAYIMCGRYCPHSISGGPGWPIKYAFYTSNPNDPARVWLSPFDASR